MTESPPIPETEAVDPREARAARRVADLERLRTIGMAMAEAMLERFSGAVSAREPVDSGAVALEYSRLSRTVMQAMALEARFDAEGAALAERIAAERAAKRDQARSRREMRIMFRADCAQAAVTEAIEAEAVAAAEAAGEAGAPDDDRTERLETRLLEFLDNPRNDNLLADLPVSELVARICKDLGVAVDWSLWEDEGWAVEEWRNATPGSPYAPRPVQPGPEAVVANADLAPGTEPNAARPPAQHDPPERRLA